MTNDITIKGCSYKFSYSGPQGSLRVANPGIVASAQNYLRISHQDYVDSKSKIPGKKHNINLTAEKVNATTGKTVTAYANLVVGQPLDTTITLSEMLAMVDGLRQIIATTAADASALNLGSNIVGTLEQ